MIIVYLGSWRKKLNLQIYQK